MTSPAGFVRPVMDRAGQITAGVCVAAIGLLAPASVAVVLVRTLVVLGGSPPPEWMDPGAWFRWIAHHPAEIGWWALVLAAVSLALAVVVETVVVLAGRVTRIGATRPASR
jgi:hypothetical protein